MGYCQHSDWRKARLKTEIHELATKTMKYETQRDYALVRSKISKGPYHGLGIDKSFRIFSGIPLESFASIWAEQKMLSIQHFRLCIVFFCKLSGSGLDILFRRWKGWFSHRSSPSAGKNPWNFRIACLVRSDSLST